MARLELRVLGGFDASLQGSEASVTLPTRKVQALLAYLALSPGQRHPREKLTSLLWGDLRANLARNNLRQALFALRRALVGVEPEPLRLESDSVMLETAAVEVDALRFEQGIAGTSPSMLQDAALLYRGDLLAGLRVQSEPFEEWLLAERERLRELALEGAGQAAGSSAPGRRARGRRAGGSPPPDVRSPAGARAPDVRCVFTLGSGAVAQRSDSTRPASTSCRRSSGSSPTPGPGGSTGASCGAPPALASDPPPRPAAIWCPEPTARRSLAVTENSPSYGCCSGQPDAPRDGSSPSSGSRASARRASSTSLSPTRPARGSWFSSGERTRPSGSVPSAPGSTRSRMSHGRWLLDGLPASGRTELAALFPDPDLATAGPSAEPSEGAARRLLEGMTALLGRLAERGPLLCVLEDLHRRTR